MKAPAMARAILVKSILPPSFRRRDPGSIAALVHLICRPDPRFRFLYGSRVLIRIPPSFPAPYPGRFLYCFLSHGKFHVMVSFPPEGSGPVSGNRPPLPFPALFSPSYPLRWRNTRPEGFKGLYSEYFHAFYAQNVNSAGLFPQAVRVLPLTVPFSV